MRKHRRNKFLISATRECIDNSERNSLAWCIWALAIIYSVQGAQHVQVDKDETRFSYRGMRYVFPTPDKSARIAKLYDDGVLTKAEIKPWTDWLKDPISIEPIQHRRPSKVAKKKVETKRRRCSRRHSSRWSGARI